MLRQIILPIIAALLLTACADFPDLDAAIAQRGVVAGFPTLIPIDPLLLSADIDSLDANAQAELLAERVRQLNIRANALRRPVIDPNSRRKMAAAVRRLNS